MKENILVKRHYSLFAPYLKEKEQVLIFLQKRSKDAPRLPDFFGFFGGSIEKGESKEQGLVREIKEELDYDLIDYNYFGEYSFKGGKKFVFCFQVDRYFEKNITVLEGDYGQFFTEKAVLEKENIADDDKIVLKDLFQKL